MADQYSDAGTAHGKSSPLRWDTTTAAAVLVLASLAYLVFAKHALRVSASGSATAGVR